MHYDFVPMPERKPLKWPNGKRLALMITLNLEYWELTQDHDGPYFPGGPSINERLLPARVPDFNNHSWREYGHRVGIWRLYEAFDEAGLPGLHLLTWNALYAPKGTPRPVIDKLNAAAVQAMADPTFKKRMIELALEMPPKDQLTPEGLAALQKADIDKWWPLMRAAGIKPQ